MSEFAKYAACLECGSDEYEEIYTLGEETPKVICRECGEEK